MKGAEVYTKATVGRELYEVKIKIVPLQEKAAIKRNMSTSDPSTWHNKRELSSMDFPSQETKAVEVRREQIQSKVRPLGIISNKIFIMRATSNAPKIKILKTNHVGKLEDISTRTCSCEEEITRDTHQGTPKLSQSEHMTSLTSTLDEATLQLILDFQISSD